MSHKSPIFLQKNVWPLRRKILFYKKLQKLWVLYSIGKLNQRIFCLAMRPHFGWNLNGNSLENDVINLQKSTANMILKISFFKITTVMLIIHFYVFRQKTSSAHISRGLRHVFEMGYDTQGMKKIKIFISLV